MLRPIQPLTSFHSLFSLLAVLTSRYNDVTVTIFRDDDMEQLVTPSATEQANQSKTALITDLKANTIDEVIVSLDRIIAWSKKNKKRTGYFAALYRKVTINVRDGIKHGHFDDGERMERLDVIFANRYLEAFEAYCNGKPTSCVWALAFELSEKWHPIVLQHLMIGMNAHINLDLGVAAAETVPKEKLSSLKDDFEKINDLLSSLVNGVQEELAQIWPPLKWLDRLAHKLDEQVADWGMKFARDRAWQFALDYSASDDKQQTLDCMDRKITLIGQLLAKPSLQLRLSLLLIRVCERGNVLKKIEILQ